MIVDILANGPMYAALDQRLAMALAFLSDPMTIELPTGRHDLEGDEIFAIVQSYRTRRPQECFWEAHRAYIDVQCVVRGAEMMGYANLDSMKVVTPYDDQKDFVQLAPASESGGESACSFLNVSEGMFVIFTPQDAHMPGLSMADGVARDVKKIVVKVRVDAGD